jgi:3-(3-hydroxy-phenyl)propionate hydroxylase
MTACRRVPVVIVGAGPTGVTAAGLLAQYGVDVLVLDRWSGVYPQARAVHLDDEIHRIVAMLGIADEFTAISRPALGLRLLDDRRRVLAEFRRDTARTAHGFPQANMFDQPDFEALLRANLARHPGVELRGDAEVTGLDEVPGGGVRVSFTDRRDRRTHTVDADYVLGCDGANSVVRTQIGSTMRDLNFEQRWLVVDVASGADLRQWEGVHQVCDPLRAGTYMRIGETRYRWEFRLRPGESADDFSTLKALRPLIAPWTGGVGDDRLDLLRVTEYTFRAQIADRWRRGNVFLLGDAAHLTPPFVGQGMGAGLRDAMNLAWKLAGVLDGTLPPELLDTYENERKPHARQMIRLALNIGRAMTAGGELGNLTRRAVVPRLRLIPGMRHKVLDSATPALHRSELVHRGRITHRLAGTLCPNPVMPDGRRLDDVLGGGFALITTAPPDTASCNLLRRRGAAVYIAETGSELARWLGRAHARAAVVRPDRTVMCAGRDAATLCARMPTFAVTTPAYGG